MNIIRVVPAVIFFLSINFVFLKAAKCNSCERRNFSEKLQECVCPNDQFCTNSTKKCSKCDQCYDKWKEVITKDKKKVENVVDNFLEGYKFDISKFKKLINILNKNIRDRQNELELITKNDQILITDIEKVSKNLNHLKEEVKKIENEFKKTEAIPVDEILKFLNEIKSSVELILQKINKLKFDSVNVSESKNFIEKLLQKFKEIDTNFPKLRNTSFSLALSTESDIELLEQIISTKENSSQPTVVKNTRWIEENLVWLFNLLKEENISVNINGLHKNSTDLRENATKIATKLEQLLKKEKEIENSYKQPTKELLEEKKFYEKLIQLDKRFQSLKNETQKLEDLLNKFRSKKTFHAALKELFEQQKRLIDKITKVNKLEPKLKKLYKEKEQLTKQYKKNFTPMEGIQVEIGKMQEEIQKITNDIVNHCSEGLKNN